MERASGRNSGVCRLEVEGSSLGVYPGHGAELAWALGEAGVHQGSVAAAALRTLHGGAVQWWCCGAVAVAAWRGGTQG